MKRKNGEGSWGKKTIKGVVYKYYRNPDGKYFYGKTEKDIKAKIKKFEEDHIKVNDKTPVCDYMKDWLYNVKQTQVKRRTFDGYEEYFNNFILNYDGYSLADISISKITDENVSRFYDSLSKNYALSTIKKINTILNQCMEYAVDKGLLTVNPCIKAIIPSEDVVAVPKKETPFLTIEDIEKLYLESKRVQTAGFKTNGSVGDFVYGNNARFVVLIMYTGLRISEALGLKWSDVNFNDKCLYVRRNLSRVKNRLDDGKSYMLVETTLKRDASRRTIPLSERALEVLTYLKEHNPSTKDTDYVCMTKTGSSASIRNITRTLNAMLVRAECEVQQCGLHALRHSFGSYLVSEGVDISIVSRLMGHKNIMVTYNIYIHVLKKSQIAAIKLFDPKLIEENMEYDEDDEG